MKIKKLWMVIIGIIFFILSGCESGGMQVVDKQDGFYSEQYRPQYHYSSKVGNLADPNGLVFFEGEYHLFHQQNGTWGHAISTDLFHWKQQEVALEHDILGQALSGSVVVDWNDSTKFFDGKAGLVAIYTNTSGGQAQSIAYSKDKGRTWERYEGNPVIKNPNLKDFRDPKVFWHEESKKWVMVVSTDKSVTFYHSDNLIDWTYLSKFGDNQGSQVAVWECPDLFKLKINGEEKWVLHVSVGDNDITNGSTAQYFIGEFNGKEFINQNDPQTELFTDYGQDYYATQTFSDIPDKDGRTIWLGWMSNWRYPYQSPTEPWMGAMSIPRELSLHKDQDGKIHLVQQPAKEVEKLRSNQKNIKAFTIKNEAKKIDFTGRTYEIEAELEWDQLNEFGIRLRKGKENETVVGYNQKEQKVFLDRSKAGLDVIEDRNQGEFQFGRKYEASLPTDNKIMKCRIFVDESSIEVFINDGEKVFTNLIYTDEQNDGIEIYVDEGELSVKSMNIYPLKSIW
ncbi:MAG: glycoside hydrolase family 32 protein [Bacillus sp. (in: firmicutes)]